MTSSIWSRPSVDGKIAPLRSAHSSAILGSTIAVFGGWDGNSVLNDLVLYKIEHHSWIFPDVKGNKPSKRAGHSGTCLGDNNSFLLFGGSNGERYLADTHIFSLDTLEWKEVQTNGIKPPARSRHSATLANGKIYIFGGSDQHTTFNSIYILDIKTMKWSIPNCKGDIPPPSWGHTSTLHNNSIYFYGGNDGQRMLNTLNILDLDTHTWRVNVATTSIGPAPSARVGHSFVEYRDSFFLMGGGNADKILNDCFVLNPTTLVWKHFSGDNPPPQRCAHSTEIYQSMVYVYGGTDGTRYFKDIYTLDPEKVFLKLENAPKKRIRLRPIKKSEDNDTTANITTTTTSSSTTTTNLNNIHILKDEPNILPVIASTPKDSLKNNNNNNNNNNQSIPIAPIPTHPLNSPTLSSSPSSSLSVRKLSISSPSLSSTSTTPSNIYSSTPPLKISQSVNGTSTAQYKNNNNHTHTSMSSSYNGTPTTTAVAKNIIQWLEDNNLMKYKSNFIENDIDMELLECLTEKHLIEDLKIPTVGARLKIINSINLLKPKKLKEKDEKEILKDAISSLQTVTTTLSTTVMTLNNMIINIPSSSSSIATTNNSNSNSSNNTSNNTPGPSPSLIGFNNNHGSGRSRRNSHY